MLHPSSSPLKEELEEVLYIGDSLVDAQTAHAAKATLVLCTWGFCTEQQLRTAQPKYMIQHPSELLNIL
jgi:phosphoglycolate phosphatase